MKLVLWDDGRVVFASPSFLETFGLAREEVERLDARGFSESLSQHGAIARAGELELGQRRFVRKVRQLARDARLETFEERSGDETARGMRDQALSVATHDLRAPLANVRSYASLLQVRMADGDPRVKRAAEVISRNADKALRLVQAWLDTQRAETGHVPLDRHDASLLPMLRESVRSRRASAGEKTVELVEVLPGQLPDTAVDRERMAHVFAAFLDNAIERARPRSRVEIRVEERGHELWFGFTDHGPAIPPDEAGAAFDRDLQIIRARKLGTGFELAVARGTIVGHGGECGVSSDAGGTTFHFTLPGNPGSPLIASDTHPTVP